jgi:hypothetical protein
MSNSLTVIFLDSHILIPTLFKKIEAPFCHNSLKSFRIIFKIIQTTVETLSRPKDNLVIPMYNDISHPSFFMKVKILNRIIIQPLHFLLNYYLDPKFIYWFPSIFITSFLFNTNSLKFIIVNRLTITIYF